MIINTDIGKDPDPERRLVAFVRERHSIYVRVQTDQPIHKNAGTKPTWTQDPILNTYRFCNVYRELDRVTQWIAKEWRDTVEHGGDPDLWFAMVVARFVNWPDTLGELGYPVPWNPKKFLEVMLDRKKRGEKLYTGAYMVRADREHKDKAAYQEEVVFTPMWEARERLRPKKHDTLNSYHTLLGQFHGLGSFMAAQIVADVKYAPPFMLYQDGSAQANTSDWWSFAASGPGSRRGLNRVLGLHYDDPWTEEDWRAELSRLAERVRPRIVGELDMDPLHNQDLQNCLCEFDKYERARLGQGKPRAKYRSHG